MPLVGVLSIEQATQQDARSVLALRHSLEAWLEARNVEQWGRGEIELGELERQVAANEWHVVRSPSGHLRAALRLLWSDEPVWREQNALAVYVHGLMVNRADAGLGLGAALLAWAEQQAREKSAPLLRLDCVESNKDLRRYYCALGFLEVGRRDFDGPWYSAVLLEKKLRLGT